MKPKATKIASGFRVYADVGEITARRKKRLHPFVWIAGYGLALTGPQARALAGWLRRYALWADQVERQRKERRDVRP